MIDPLAEVVTLLQPTARFSKQVVGAGPWQIRRSDAGQPFYCVVLEGGCRLTLDGHETIVLQTGDFVLIPAALGIAMSSLEPPTDLRILAGHCSFGSPDVALLVSLLPQLVHVRGEQRPPTQYARDQAIAARTAIV